SYLNAFRYGCINVHFSLLPKYRGAAPVNWAIVKGETETGITTMRMDRGLDTGDILLQHKTAIGKRENSVELMERLSVKGAELLSDTLRRINDIVPVSQDQTEATLAPMMSKDDGLIDWNQTAKEISDQIRGFQPFPRSFTSYGNEKLTIWDSEALDEKISTGMPGEILKVVPEGLLVSCGSNTVLKILELQAAGKRRMNSRDFLNGIRMEAGDVLGA
ncbi:MAG: methionyl-tRNA formyltransferase, partial [Pyrinomonadaceae bacterium]|nr:methionyl-tRNA formyltransferase [Pyrinomonadaceae bacterium]